MVDHLLDFTRAPARAGPLPQISIAGGLHPNSYQGRAPSELLQWVDHRRASTTNSLHQQDLYSELLLRAVYSELLLRAVYSELLQRAVYSELLLRAVYSELLQRAVYSELLLRAVYSELLQRAICSELLQREVDFSRASS